MRLLFLDVDYVLNKKNTNIFTPDGDCFVEDEKVELLKELIDKTNAKVVLSSTWREGWEDDKNNLDTKNRRDFILLKNKFLEYGIELYDYTSLPVINDRSFRILEYLNKYKEDISSILILDDIYSMEVLNKYFLKTSILEGLTSKHVKKGINILLKDDFQEWSKKKEIFK